MRNARNKNKTSRYCHGLSKTAAYNSWKHMRERVRNPNSWAYKWYGARGIDIDPRWDDFAVFFADMGDRPPGVTLERVDNNRGYWPDNCVWVPQSAQPKNSRWVKLSYAIAEEIRSIHAKGGVTGVWLAKQYQVSYPLIRKILSREVWDKP